MPRYMVRVSLSDRPGALGQVASRIGAVGGDIIAVDITGRSQGRAIDEFVIDLAASHVGLLRNEVQEVDGTTVESVRLTEPELAGDE
jgi:UTP:GlnB (protein PII) uridylyltransferase